MNAREFDRGWLQAHGIANCEIRKPWGWRIESAFPSALMVLGNVAVVATILYSIRGSR